MMRISFYGNIRRIAAMLVVLALPLGIPARGGDAVEGRSADVATDTQSKRITLSLKIAEAKKEESSRRYFLSLLRQKKRNPFRQIFPGQSGFPPAP
jgi:hypothetical protein